MSHGGATLIVFLVGVIALIGLVYLFTEPLVTAAVHFGQQIPTLVREAKKGHGPLGRLVFRLHLQKYLSEGSTKITSQITKVLKPATAFSVGAAAVSTLVSIVTIAILTFFTMLEAPRLWSGFLSLFRPTTADRLRRVVDESIRSVTGLHARERVLTSVIAGVIIGDHPDHPRRALRAAPGGLRRPGRPAAAGGRAAGRGARSSSSRPSTPSRPGSSC